MASLTRICEWCSREYTPQQTGRGRPSPYCSETCKHEAQNSLARTRMAHLRERRREAEPWARKPRGRPPKG